MASSKPSSSIIDFGDSRESQPELQFQDFSHDEITPAATLDTSDLYSGFPGSPDASESAGLLDQDKKSSSSSFWEFKYYQNFFDIDTDQVIQRITGSFLPMPGRSTYLDRLIRPSPDLYGPFWIATTLVFSVAISANIAEFFMTEGKDRVWHYDLHKVSLAATVIYSYVFLLPFAFWGVLWYQYSSAQYTLLEVVCVYGYSLSVYVPISILWLIQVSWLQWLLVIIGALMSGAVLVHTFWPAVNEGSKKLGVLLLCLVLVFHTLLAAGFVAYFFRPPHTTSVQLVTNAPIPSAITETVVAKATPKVMDHKFIGISDPATTSDNKKAPPVHKEESTPNTKNESSLKADNVKVQKKSVILSDVPSIKELTSSISVTTAS